MAGKPMMAVRAGAREVCELFDAQNEERLDAFCRVAIAPIRQDILGMAEHLGVRSSVIEQIGERTVQLVLPTEDVETSDRLVVKSIYTTRTDDEPVAPEAIVSLQPSLSLLRQSYRAMLRAYCDNFGLLQDSDYEYCRREVVALVGRMGLAQYLFDTLQKNVHPDHPVVASRDSSFARSSFAGFMALELLRQIPDGKYTSEAREAVATSFPGSMHFQVHQVSVRSNPNRSLELNDMTAKGLMNPMSKEFAIEFIRLFNSNSKIRNRLKIV